jgi:hypothetical protein
LEEDSQCRALVIAYIVVANFETLSSALSAAGLRAPSNVIPNIWNSTAKNAEKKNKGTIAQAQK